MHHSAAYLLLRTLLCGVCSGAVGECIYSILHLVDRGVLSSVTLQFIKSVLDMQSVNLASSYRRYDK